MSRNKQTRFKSDFLDFLSPKLYRCKQKIYIYQQALSQIAQLGPLIAQFQVVRPGDNCEKALSFGLPNCSYRSL